MKKGRRVYEKALAEMRHEHPDVRKAFLLLEEALGHGSPDAAYALGTWYLHGRHVAKDVEEGLRLIDLAARADVADACYDLAVSYEKGEFIVQDLERAFALYVRAMLNGDKQSIYEVGRFLFHGIGVARNEQAGQLFVDFAREKGIDD